MNDLLTNLTMQYMKPMQYQLLCTNLLNIEKKDENESDISISKLRSESCLM